MLEATIVQKAVRKFQIIVTNLVTTDIGLFWKADLKILFREKTHVMCSNCHHKGFTVPDAKLCIHTPLCQSRSITISNFMPNSDSTKTAENLSLGTGSEGLRRSSLVFMKAEGPNLRSNLKSSCQV